jgi:hypothetical protein
MAKQFHVYDALYAFCKSEEKREKLLSSRHWYFLTWPLVLLTWPLRAKTDIFNLIRPDGNYAKQEKISLLIAQEAVLWYYAFPHYHYLVLLDR